MQQYSFCTNKKIGNDSVIRYKNKNYAEMAINTSANQNIAPKGELEAHFEASPEISEEDLKRMVILEAAKESFLQKFFGITLNIRNPGNEVIYLDARRHPEEYQKPASLLNEKFEVANDNSVSQEQQQAA